MPLDTNWYSTSTTAAKKNKGASSRATATTECLGSNKDNASSNHSSHGWSLKYPFPKRMWRAINEDMCHCAEKNGELYVATQP